VTDPHGVETAQTEAGKKTAAPTKRDVTALLAEFEPAPAPQKSAVEKERERRVERVQAIIRDAATRLQQNGVADGTPADALAAFKALQTAGKRAVISVNSLTARQLELSEDDAPAKAPRAKRTSAPKAETPAEQPRVEEIVTSGGDTIVVAPDSVEEPSAEDEPLYKVEETKLVPALTNPIGAPTRSGPAIPASSDPRGAEDPNLGDGF
jgi:hypothetical protein